MLYKHRNNLLFLYKIIPMTRFFRLLCIALLSITFLGGCSGTGTLTGTTYTMSATVGTTPFNGGICIAVYNPTVSDDLAISGSTLSGSIGGPPQINLNIINWPGGTGTFILGPASTMTFGNYVASASATTKISTSGYVIITSMTSGMMTGSFAFTCDDGTVISAGRFNAKRY